MAWLIATVIAMLLLAWGKETAGRQLDNPVLQTEARVTLIDAWLATSVLLGVGLTAAFGWWWADPAAALVIVYYGVRAGREARRRAELIHRCSDEHDKRTRCSPATHEHFGATVHQ